MKVTIVSNPGCVHCGEVSRIFEKLKPEYKNLEVEDVSTITQKGLDLVSKYTIMASPGVIIDGELAFVGNAGEDQIRKALDAKN